MSRRMLAPDWSRLGLAFLWGAALVAISLAITVGFGRAQVGGPSDQTTLDLTRSVPFDRITLVDVDGKKGDVLNVEPLFPRPLPTIAALKERDTKKKETPVGVPPEGNVGVGGGARKKNQAKTEEDVPTRITIHLLEGDVRDFSIDRSSIKKVDYYEDMLLAEGDRVLLSRDYAKAFEYYLAVYTRDSHWKGVSDRVDKVLLDEGTLALLESDGERGLRLLRELHARKPDYPGLADRLAKAYVARIDKSLDSGAYVLGRRVLHDVEQLTPTHKLVIAAHDRFVARAKRLLEEAGRRQGSERLDLASEALRIWPRLEGAEALYQEAFAQTPTLDVAVVDLPQPVSPWVRCPADSRAAQLVYVPILASTDQDALEGKVPGQLAVSVTAADLGRRLIVELRKDVSWSDGTRAVAAIDLARTLADRADPFSIGYRARWAELLDRVETPEPNRVEIRLTRAALRPEAWLTNVIGPAQAGPDGWVVTTAGRFPIGDGPYRWESSARGIVRYRAWGPKESAATPKIQRIREARFPSAKAVVGTLLRGDVSLAEHVSHIDLPTFQQNQDIKIGSYRIPSMHYLALDGRNNALRNRTLRRAISYAIDRKTLLEEVLLRASGDEVNVPADGPFQKESYANAPAVRPLAHDFLLAKSLVVAAKKELDAGVLRLTFEFPATAEARVIVPKLVESFREIGLEIDPVEVGQSELEVSLRSGRRFDLVYRTFRCSEPALEAGPLICPGYDAAASTNSLASVASPRILQLLLQLEQLTEWPTARGVVLQIDRECRDELPIIPLWQLGDHYAWRTRLTGPAESTDRLYQGIETWEISPWYARDPW